MSCSMLPNLLAFLSFLYEFCFFVKKCDLAFYLAFSDFFLCHNPASFRF